MTVTLTYNSSLARVEIDCDDLGDAPIATIERSVDQVRWTTVRGAVSLAVTAGAIATHYDYEFKPDVANYYRVTVDPRGLYLPGTSGNYASTPDTAVLDITGDIDLRVDVTIDDWTQAANWIPLSKWTTTGNQRAYALQIGTSGQPSLLYSNDGSASNVRLCLTAVPATSGRLAIRATLDVNNGAGGNTATFYTADTIAGPWTQLGAPVVTASTTSIFNSSAALTVGGHSAGTSSLFDGVVHAAEVRNGIDGTVVADPDFDVQTHLAMGFADDAGRTWTVNGTAQILTVQTANVTPALTGVRLVSPVRPFLNMEISLGGRDFDVDRDGRGAAYSVMDRSLPVGVSQMPGGSRFDLLIRTATDEEDRQLDFLIAGGDVLYLNAPDGSTVPSGGIYVLVDQDRRRTLRNGGERRHRVLPVQEVVPPGPDVGYALETWATILANYGTLSALLAANSTLADLLALLADPSEVIVE